MTTHAHFLRQLLLVLRLQSLRRAIPFEELRDYLLEQTSLRDLAANYSQRTFQRDLPKIAERFGVTIAHDRRAGGYVVTSTDPLPEGYQRLLDAFELQEFLRLPTALSPFVQWESRRPLGTEWLQPLLRAVQQRRQVAFQYRKFWDDEPSARTVSPLLLKEFKGRWYLLAHDPARQGLRCFGLDRIQALKPTTHAFEPPAGFEPEAYYAHSFGIIRPDHEPPAKIVLALKPTQGQYLKSFPLHSSQHVLVDTDEELRIQLTVYNTHDLLMELLSLGDQVQVLAPTSLRKQITQIHAAAMKASPA
ncbi:helix-turn-helix transcriptional regulator [Hymenobacter psychrotolerans]|uniref:Predicted DNA-binding transcriptional regulator YafY, contains an HTH and WYL domains n=1 Tax=Hymenobacter psychrotolerans DSM 18569 TaxID=1121959 RepID=A0A1M7EGU7_9BACT|nr:WYL domain-containing protein [Hymenobacter psychrotolerans]SHL90953.1 Predicted DNA-binding transcriptional regulator YafY, contains an HTH and WYL domains [Hymenobacter psychrotolerans DSM 18569]